jgi:hypothetical protein
MQPLPLLHQAVDVATSGRRRCRCYIRPSTLLPQAAATATCGHRRCCKLRT